MKTFLFSLIVCSVVATSALKTGHLKTSKLNVKNIIQTDFSVPLQSPLEMKTAMDSKDNFDELSNKSTDPKRGKDHDWYSKAMSNIKKSEYKITFNEELNTYQSPNRENNMRFVYHKNGFTAKLRNNKIPLFDESDKMIEEKDKKYIYPVDWKINFMLESVSKELNSDCENNFIDFTNNDLIINENRISVENDNLRIQYCNDESGMRQDFIVKNKPEGEGSLRLNLNSDTELKMIVGAEALMFKDNDGDLKLKYSSLKCWDANGRELRAYFEDSYKSGVPSYGYNQKREESCNLKLVARNCFSIVVNDEDAVYPVTIDPLSSVPSWDAQINQASANFGWSVATAGDVNGDGYSDVIVGAPLFDNGQADEGAVFVYHGSINGLSLAPGWTKEINQVAALFGWSVATAGDINGDGYSDVIIGSPAFDNGQADEGKAFVYTGSPTGLSSIELWSYETNQVGANFGYSVACLGDLNYDAYSDVIIGSPFFDNGNHDEGRAFIFKGNGITLLPIIWTSEGNQDDAHMGFSVSTAGDVNGDGYSDILVGGYQYDNSFSDDGRVYAFYSTSTTYPSSPSWIKNGSQTDEYFGYSVSTAGDINGDGYSDVVIGAPLYSNGQINEGKCYAYLGSASGLGASAVWTTESNESGGQLGKSVSTAGDINGDGYADIIVGGDYLENGQTDEGRALLYLGNSTGVSTNSIIAYEKNQSGSAFGHSVATAGDVNGDGFSDVIIGAYKYDDPSVDEGAAFVYYGSTEGMSQTPVWSAEGGQSLAAYGFSVSEAGDINSDGYSDVIIGAPEYDNGHIFEGAAFLYLGSSTGFSSFPNWSQEGNQSYAFFGVSVSTAGDVNGDGYADVIVGAAYYDNGQADEGAAFVYLGSATGLSILEHVKLEVNQIDAQFGYSVSNAGDVNGDGFQDVVIGARNYDNGQTDEGVAFVYLGSPIGILQSSRKILECNRQYSFFGESVSEAGDINGDGFSDVIVGAPTHDSLQSDAGASFLYLGSASGISTTINWAYINFQIDSFYGEDVSSAGDVNGDGYSDVMIASPRYKSGTTEVGLVNIFHGSLTGLSVFPNQTIQGILAGAPIATSISSAGDVNGDGYSDIIIGGNTSNFAGAAYIYKGSSSGISGSPIWTKNFSTASSNFGSSVSVAGDVNGDGYSDVIIGAYSYTSGQSSEGAAFLFYGGNNLPGLHSNTRQFKPMSSDVISSGMNSGINGNIKLQQFARSPFGIGSGRLIFDIQPNGVSFQGSIISNSTAFNANSNYFNFGLTGTDISKEVSSLNKNKLYKWRSRVQYNMTSFPFQKFGPWKYFNNYTPSPHGNFRPRESPIMLLNLTMLIQGFYNPEINTMIADTVSIFLRNTSSPYGIIDTANAYINSSGAGSVLFIHAVNGTPYYIQVHHRNSIETWSSTTPSFVSSQLVYNFTTAANKAYGDNLIQVNSSPLRFAMFGGDVNQDGTIDASDLSTVENDASFSLSGYVQTDLTGDDYVDAGDLSIVENNASSGVSAIIP